MGQRGITKAQLARELEVTNAHVANWLSGQMPRGDQLLLIARHFNTTIEYLLTGEGPAPAPAPTEFANLRQIKAEAERLAGLLGQAETSLSKLRSFLG